MKGVPCDVLDFYGTEPRIYTTEQISSLPTIGMLYRTHVSQALLLYMNSAHRSGTWHWPGRDTESEATGQDERWAGGSGTSHQAVETETLHEALLRGFPDTLPPLDGKYFVPLLLGSRSPYFAALCLQRTTRARIVEKQTQSRVSSAPNVCHMRLFLLCMQAAVEALGIQARWFSTPARPGSGLGRSGNLGRGRVCGCMGEAGFEVERDLLCIASAWVA